MLYLLNGGWRDGILLFNQLILSPYLLFKGIDVSLLLFLRLVGRVGPVRDIRRCQFILFLTIKFG
jgi:hypothetical protein